MAVQLARNSWLHNLWTAFRCPNGIYHMRWYTLTNQSILIRIRSDWLVVYLKETPLQIERTRLGFGSSLLPRSVSTNLKELIDVLNYSVWQAEACLLLLLLLSWLILLSRYWCSDELRHLSAPLPFQTAPPPVCKFAGNLLQLEQICTKLLPIMVVRPRTSIHYSSHTLSLLPHYVHLY